MTTKLVSKEGYWSTIQLYVKPEYPIIMVYSVGSLGTVKFCLVPQAEESDD